MRHRGTSVNKQADADRRYTEHLYLADTLNLMGAL